MIYYLVWTSKNKDEGGKFLSKEKAIQYLLIKFPDEATAEQEKRDGTILRIRLKRKKGDDNVYDGIEGHQVVATKYEVVGAELLEVTKHVQEEVKEEGKIYIPRKEWAEEKVIRKDMSLYVRNDSLSDCFKLEDEGLTIELPIVYFSPTRGYSEELKTIERKALVYKQKIDFIDEEEGKNG